MAVVLAAGFFLRFHVNEMPGDGVVLPRHDESHYVDLTRQFLSGDFDVDYFINPTAYAYAMYGATALVGAAQVAIGGVQSFGELAIREMLHPYWCVLAGRWITLLSGVACILLTAAIGRRLFGAHAGLVAGLAMAVDKIAIRRSDVAGNEMPMVAVGLLAVLVQLRAADREGAAARRLALAAGALVGVAAALKYSGGAFALPVMLCFGRLGLVSVLAAPVGFLAATPSIALDFAEFVGGFGNQYAYLHEGYSASDLDRMERGWIHYVRRFPATNVGLPFSIACAIGLLLALATAWKRDRASRLLIASTLPLYAFLGSGIFSTMRFLLPAIPFVLLAGARVVDAACRRLRASPWVGVTAATLMLAWPAVETHQSISREFGPQDPRFELLAFLRGALDPSDRVVDFSYPPGDRLLEEEDPWSVMGVANANAPEQVAAIEADLRLRVGRLASNELGHLFRTLSSLDELKRHLSRRKIGRVVVSVPFRWIGHRDEMLEEPGLLYLAKCSWWREAFDWLQKRPIVESMVSSDGTKFVAVFDVSGAS